MGGGVLPMSAMSDLWFEGIPVASTTPDETSCSRCGRDVPAHAVCCADFVTAPDGLMEFDPDNTLCVECCGPHVRRLNVGHYERMDCDQ